MPFNPALVEHDHIPSLTAQGLEVTPIPNGKLTGNSVKFNGALFQWNNRRLIGYRRYDPRHGRSNIALSELGPDWMPTGWHHVIKLPVKTGDERWEDARFFVHDKSLWMSCTEIPSGRGEWACWQRLYRLKPNFDVDYALDIEVGKNLKYGISEKNWTYVSVDGKLYLIYDMVDMTVYEIDDKTGKPVAQWKQSPILWDNGCFRGGTTPWRQPDGTFLVFIHSCDPRVWHDRRYSMSAVTMEGKPPFKILAASYNPICRGTRMEPVLAEGNHQCVFPMGIIATPDKWHVSMGINDSFNCVMHLDPQKVKDGMVKASYFQTQHYRYFKCVQGRGTQVTKAGFKWSSVQGERGRTSMRGLLKTSDTKVMANFLVDPDVQEITPEEYAQLLDPNNRMKTTTPVANAPVPASEPDAMYRRIGAYHTAMKDGWTDLQKVTQMADAIVENKTKISLEIGCYAGKASIGMGIAHQELHEKGIPSTFHIAIDAWSAEAACEGTHESKHKDWWGKLDYKRIQKEFTSLIVENRLEPFCKWHKLKSAEAAKLFEPGTIGLLYWDGNHSEQVSCMDVEAYAPLVADKGFWYFNDTQWPQLAKAQGLLEGKGFICIETAESWKVFQKTQLPPEAKDEPVRPIYKLTPEPEPPPEPAAIPTQVSVEAPAVEPVIAEPNVASQEIINP